jgi:hypothetical protein
MAATRDPDMVGFKEFLIAQVKWLRANPLGSLLTVCLSGLLAVFIVPQLFFFLTGSASLMLFLTLVCAPLVPYALFRVHHTPWKPLVGIWVVMYLAAWIRMPLPLKRMPLIAVSEQMCAWFLIGMCLTAGYAFFINQTIEPAPRKKQDEVKPPVDDIAS